MALLNVSESYPTQALSESVAEGQFLKLGRRHGVHPSSCFIHVSMMLMMTTVSFKQFMFKRRVSGKI